MELINYKIATCRLKQIFALALIFLFFLPNAISSPQIEHEEKSSELDVGKMIIEHVGNSYE